ncbi:class I adenylate-forming enzyme family protein [Amycolatopsis sp. NPDC059021]|uniref:class I adenylate-forming enzyme family protein n=1 Tax=Amycolatopsis sp. NPDC059021 TaxID=3346704 RepID=UPI00366DB19F
MTTLPELVSAAHRRFAEQPAVLVEHGAITFAELGAQARSVAYTLAELGLRPGDRVVIALDNRPEVLAVEHGVWLGGCVRVAVSTRLHPEEIAGIAADCAAAVVVCAADLAARLDELSVCTPEQLLRGGAGPEPPHAPGDLVALMYTSGSTGKPKGARVTSAAWVAMLEAMWSALPPIGPGDVVLHVAPMSHFGGSVGSAYTLAGAAALPLPRFDAESALATARRHGVTAIPLVPTMLDRLVAVAERDPLPVKAVIYGGAPIHVPAQIRARAVFGDVLYQFYGLSEALAPLTVLSAVDHADPDSHRLASVGRPVSSVELSVVDDQGKRVPNGEIRVRGPQIMPGYWNGAEIPAGGWFATGDLGFVDEDGYLHLTGRRSELIVTGGFNVYPAEVENAIAALDGVAEVAVLGVPDNQWGETVAAVVVAEDGHDLSEVDIRRACADRLAGYKKPRRIVFADRLPVNSTGKVAKQVLRSWF